MSEPTEADIARALRLLEPPPKSKVLCSNDLYEQVAPFLLGHEVERLVIVYFDRLFGVLGTETLSIGGAAHTVVDVPFVLRSAIRSGCVGFAIAHNHASSRDPEPSPGDLEMTIRVAAAAQAVGLTLVDHIVVGGPNSYVSIKERGGVP